MDHSEEYEPLVILASEFERVLIAGQAELKPAGYKIVICSDSQSTFDALKQGLPDILIIDCDMKTEDGTSVVYRVAEQTETSEPLIMLILHREQYPPKWMWDKTVYRHYHGYLWLYSDKKPFARTALREYVRRMLDHFRYWTNTRS